MLRLLWLLWLALVDVDPSGGGDPPADDGDGDPNDDDDEPDTDDDADADEATRDPEAKIKALKEILDRKDRQAKKREERIKELEGQAGSAADANGLRMENAFLRAVMAQGETLDTETTWALLQSQGFIDAVKDNGEGMDDALSKTVERYPWLADVSTIPEDEPPTHRPPRPGIGTGRRPPANAPHVDASIRERFPALQHRRGR
jgi:hypothetical protein